MGAGTFRQQVDTQKHTAISEGKKLTFAVSHMCGWRRFMEDADLAVSPLSDGKNSLFAIFDGHGGSEVAIFAQRHFVTELQANENYIRSDYEPALRETFMKMDELMKEPKGKSQIKEIQKQQNELNNGPLPTQSQAGCTANVWLITPEYIYVANSGDSRGVLCINGKCQQMSKDHKPDDAQELARIKKAGGQVTMGRVNGNINLSRALGDFEFKQNPNLPPEEQMITANPDIRKIKNQNLDFAIIGCDGIWEEKSCEEMVKWIHGRMLNETNLGKILEELFDELIAEERTIEAHGTDNMSAILVNFNTHTDPKNKKKDKLKNNECIDQIGPLLKKYLLHRQRESDQKKHKQIFAKDQIVKLLNTKYIHYQF